jgi:hypothetical protein
LPSKPSSTLWGGGFSGCCSKRARSNHCTVNLPLGVSSAWASESGSPNSARLSASLAPRRPSNSSPLVRQALRISPQILCPVSAKKRQLACSAPLGKANQSRLRLARARPR